MDIPDTETPASLEVALFPIPSMVVFPHTIVPLHVFEPRYRQMVNDCVDKHRMIAICHTEKEIRSAPKMQEPADALKNNQATYKPYEIFSAGYCDIDEVLDDGRIYLRIYVEKRLRMISEVQTLPYRIANAVEIVDADADGAEELKLAVNHQLKKITRGRDERLDKMLSSDTWISQSPYEFSFKLFQFIRFDADVMQHLLETTSTRERLEITQSLLNQVG